MTIDGDSTCRQLVVKKLDHLIKMPAIRVIINLTYHRPTAFARHQKTCYQSHLRIAIYHATLVWKC